MEVIQEKYQEQYLFKESASVFLLYSFQCIWVK